MDGFEEKKWFVYLGDHHEGPFSLADIQQRMAHGQVTATSFVWAEGQGEWKAMAEVPAFSSLTRRNGAGTNSGAVGAGPAIPAITIFPQEPSIKKAAAAPQPEPTLTMEAPALQSHERTKLFEPKIRESDVPPSAAAMHTRKILRLVRAFIVLGLGIWAINFVWTGNWARLAQSPAVKKISSGFNRISYPTLAKVADKIPGLGSLLSPLPPMEDVAPDDYADLTGAASAKLEQEGGKVAFALSRTDLNAPVFHVATNLPDGAQFTLYIEGIADTLLSQAPFSAKVSLTANKKQGTSEPLRQTDRSPIPRGKYSVFVTEADTQTPAIKGVLDQLSPSTLKTPAFIPRGVRLVTMKSYFLGGVEDTAYTAQLKQMHEKIQIQAQNELDFLKKFTGTLDSQMLSTTKAFAKASAKPVRRAAWNKFDQEWGKAQAEVSLSAQQWTPDALANHYFYGVLYQAAYQAALTVAKVHEVENGFFTQNPAASPFAIQHGEAIAVAQSTLGALHAKIEQAEKMPPTPNGMPRREGL